MFLKKEKECEEIGINLLKMMEKRMEKLQMQHDEQKRQLKQIAEQQKQKTLEKVIEKKKFFLCNFIM